MALRAMGIAHRELLDVPAATQHLLRAVRLAEGAGLAVRAGEARLSLALQYLQEGMPRRALRELHLASDVLGDGHAQVHNQIAAVYIRLGRYDVALAAASRALAVAEAGGDVSLTSLVLGNRGIAYGYLGRLPEAERDLRRAVQLSRELGEALGALDGLHNLGWVLARGGDLPGALQLYDEAEQGIGALGVPLAVYQVDRCEALLLAGLGAEAWELAQVVVEELEASGMDATLPEALVLRARACVATGDTSGAAADARRAAALLRDQGRRSWAAFARSLHLQAVAVTVPVPDPDLCAQAVATAADLHDAGWPEAELQARLVAARLTDDRGAADAQLRAVAEHRTSRDLRLRVLGWQAEAQRRSGADDPAGALRAVDAGLRALRRHRSVLGATELHASAAVDGHALGALAVGIALRSGRPARVLTWSERLRATTLLRAPVRPPGDAELAADLSALRAATAEVHEARLRDEPPPIGLLRRQRALEAAVRRRSHHARGAGDLAPPTPSPATLRDLLDGRRLVSYVEHAGRLHAVVLHGRTTTLLECGAAAAVDLELRHLGFALRRVVQGDESGRDAVSSGAERLALLLRTRDLPGAPEVGAVVAPTAALHAVPWSLLPGLDRGPVEVTASVSMWSRPAEPQEGGVLVLAGPGLVAAAEEVRAVAAAHPGDVSVLPAGEVTSERVLAGLDGARLAHLACHAVFRGDAPMFSALLLEDGPLTVYDLEGLRRAPSAVVLSACDSGRSGVRAGVEVLGLAAALASLGTRTLIASVVPVGDAATSGLMARLHREWAAGCDPASALARAQAGADTADRATAAAFVCLQSGQC